jgi:hypothetical protein
MSGRGLGVELDFKQLTQIAEITEPGHGPRPNLLPSGLLDYEVKLACCFLTSPQIIPRTGLEAAPASHFD